MRAAFVLALLLGIAAPQGVWPPSAEASSAKGAASAMAAPAAALCQLVRDSARAEKTFSSGWLPALDRASAFPLAVDGNHPVAHPSLPHAIAIDGPPLAPRPPPFN